MRSLDDVIAATRDHRRKLRLRNLLLLAARTLLIVAIVLAAAGPTLRRTVPLARHSPTAAVIIVDNSASSSAILDGDVSLVALKDAARRVLERATPADRLWLQLADGVARPGTAPELIQRLEQVEATAAWYDLGEAVSRAAEIITTSARPGEVIVISDGQASAIVPVPVDVPVHLIRPESPAPANRSIASLSADAQPWGLSGGRLDVVVGAGDSTAIPIEVRLGGRSLPEMLVVPGLPSSIRTNRSDAGWHSAEAVLPPDEFRLDDHAETAVRVAAPPRVNWDAQDRYIDAAMQVLAAEHRIARGNAIALGQLSKGASVVTPPADQAQTGSLNRALAARGIHVQFGSAMTGGRTDSTALLPAAIPVSRWTQLEVAAGSAVDTLITISGEPWAVRVGDVILIGSRLDPEWTALPVLASFVPFLDRLLTGVIRGGEPGMVGVAGRPTRLPARITAISQGGQTRPVEGGSLWRPAEAGVAWLLTGTDTVGSITVGIDARESQLVRADERHLKGAWPGAVIGNLEDGPDAAFTSGGRGDLLPILLLVALLCVVAESVLAGRAALPR